MKFDPSYSSEKDSKSTGGAYLRLKDGDVVKGVFYGEPKEKWGRWVNKKFEELPKEDPSSKVRYTFHFITHDGEKFICQQYECGPSIKEQLNDVAESFGDTSTVKVKISRKGATQMDTEYKVIALPNEPLPTGFSKMAEALIRSHEEKITKPNQPPPGNFDSEMGDPGPELPF